MSARLRRPSILGIAVLTLALGGCAHGHSHFGIGYHGDYHSFAYHGHGCGDDGAAIFYGIVAGFAIFEAIFGCH